MTFRPASLQEVGVQGATAVDALEFLIAACFGKPGTLDGTLRPAFPSRPPEPFLPSPLDPLPYTSPLCFPVPRPGSFPGPTCISWNIFCWTSFRVKGSGVRRPHRAVQSWMWRSQFSLFCMRWVHAGKICVRPGLKDHWICPQAIPGL